MNSTGSDTSSGDDKEAVGCVSSKWTKNKQSSLLAAFFIQFVKESILCKEPCLASCPDGWDEGSGRCILFSLGPRPREFICTTPICTGGMCVSVSRWALQIYISKYLSDNTALIVAISASVILLLCFCICCITKQKIPSEMEVAPRYNCWHCWHCWHC